MGRFLGSVAGLFLALAALPAHAATIVYNDLTSGPLAGYVEPNSGNPAFGDTLHLTQSGTLASLGLTLFNGDANGGVILTGFTDVYFFDNTTPYAGGSITNPLLATGTAFYDFTSQNGLAAGSYDARLVDFSFLGVHLPQDILIVQQFTETSGNSTANGMIIQPNPTIGISPNTIFVSSAFTPAGLYTFSGLPGQFGYLVEVQPDATPLPASAAGGMALLAGLAIWRFKRRHRT